MKMNHKPNYMYNDFFAFKDMASIKSIIDECKQLRDMNYK